MTGLNHVLTGTVLALSIKNPVIAPLVSLLSHFILDAIPHFGNFTSIYAPYTKVFKRYLAVEAIGITLILVFALIFFTSSWWLIFVCSFCAIAPDIFWLIEKRLLPENRFRKMFYRLHQGIQWKERPWGWIIEVPYAALMVILLFKLEI